MADEDAAVLSKAPAGALAPRPSSYEQGPKLGRPLPGDLGRPIFRRQQQSGLAAAAGAPQSMIDQAAAEQREQQTEEQRAARESAILALSADEEMSVATPSNLKETDVPAINGDRLALGPIRDTEAQQRKTDLISTASLSGGKIGRASGWERCGQYVENVG